MPAEWKKLPMDGDVYSNVDETELNAISATVVDGYVNELDHTVRRPGLTQLVDLGTSAGIDGLYWWDQQTCAIAVSGGRVFQINDFTGTNVELTGTTLNSGTRATFTTDGTKIVMANGGKMVHATKSGALTQMADVDAPTTVSHVAYLDGYVLANKTSTGQVYFADPADLTSWNALDLMTAEGRPDYIVAVHEGWQELAFVGKESVEIWVNDGVTPFSRLAGGVTQRGCSAPYSFQQVGNAWFWLDDKRRFVQLDARTPTEVLCPYAKAIQGFASVDDAVSDVMSIAGQEFYIISFPLARQTFAYNYKKKNWTQWGYWDTNTASYGRFLGNAYCYAKPWNLHLWGDYSTGIIYTASRSVFTDNGDPMRTLRRTGFIDHGTPGFKRSHELSIKVKRGQGSSSVSDPQYFLKWRNTAGSWGNEHYRSLGQVGQHEIISRFHRLGTYKVRQWEIACSDDCDFILVEGKELVDA